MAYIDKIKVGNIDYDIQDSQLKSAFDDITGQTYNLVSYILKGLTVDTSGGMVNYGGTTDMVVAPVEQGKTYTIKTDDASSFVGAFYTNKPTASTVASYNNSRIVNRSKTFTAPITGYVAFRTSTSYPYAQIVEGIADKEYIQPITAVDLNARNDITEIDSILNKISEHTYNLIIGKIVGKSVDNMGKIAANQYTDLWVAPIIENHEYIVQTKGNAGLVYGFFAENPLEDLTLYTYDTDRVVATGETYTFTAPITGYIAFTSANGMTGIQISEGDSPKSYIEPTESATDIEARNSISNILHGKILCCCGDSITYGADMDSDGIASESTLRMFQSNNSGDFSIVTSNYLKTWGYQIAERNNMIFYNAGVSGSTVQGLSDKNGFSLANGRYTKLPDNIDYLLLWFGWNDTAYGTLGTIADTTNESFYGGYNVVLPYLINKYPYAKIGIIVPFGCDVDHREAVRLIGNKWGIAVWDNYKGGTPLYYGKEPDVGVDASIVTANQTKFQANGAHPNFKGHTELSHMIENWMRGM